MISTYLIISVLLLQSASIVVGLMQRAKANSLLEFRRIEDQSRFAKRLSRFQAIVAMLGVLYFLDAAGLVYLSLQESWTPEELFFPGIWYAINLFLLAISASILFRAAGVIARPDAPSKNASLHRSASRLHALGTNLILLPVVAMLLVPLWMIVIPFAISFIFLMANKRRVDQGTVLWTMALAVRSGRPVDEELEAVADDLSTKHRRRVFYLIDLLRDGEPLEEAIASVPLVVPHWAMLEIQVGAGNGQLSQTLTKVALKQTDRKRGVELGPLSPTLPLLYILVVPLVAQLIVFGIMKWIIPKFKEIFQGFEQELPQMTVNVIRASDAFQEYYWLILILPLVAMYVIASSYIRGWGEHDLGWFGRWFRRFDTPEILRNLGTATARNGPLEPTLHLIQENHRRGTIRKAIGNVLSDYRDGGDCWVALHQAGLITRHETTVLQAAERANNLPWALSRLAEGIESRFAYRGRTVIEYLQPVVVIGLGIFCAYLVIAFFLPIVKLVGDLSPELPV